MPLSYLVGGSDTPVPPQAAAVGYNTKTFDSTTLSNQPGDVYYPAGFYGYPGIPATQNADGSFTAPGSEGFACTAGLNRTGPNQFSGVAFGGGAYFETIASWQPGTGAAGASWPAIWFNDAETMAYNKVTGSNIWPGLTAVAKAGNADIVLNFPSTGNYAVGNRIVFGGSMGSVTGLQVGTTYYIVQTTPTSIRVAAEAGACPIIPSGSGSATLVVQFGTWIEVDCEYDAGSTSELGYTLHSWNGFVGDGHQAHETWGAYQAITGANTFANPNKFGMLWVPATATSQGYVSFYFNDQIADTAKWNLYNPSTPPPPLMGSSAFSIIDQRHLIPIISTSTVYPMTVSSWKVWQGGVGNNIVNP